MAADKSHLRKDEPLSRERIAAILAGKDISPMNFKAAASGKEASLETKQNLPEGGNVFGTSGVESIISQQKLNADGSSTNTKTTSYEGGGSQKIIDSTPSGAAGNQNAGVENNPGFSEFIEIPEPLYPNFSAEIEEDRLRDTAAFAENNKIRAEARTDYGKSLSNYFKQPSMADIANLERRNTMDALEAYEADEPIRRIKAMDEVMDKGFNLPFKRSVFVEDLLGVKPTRGEAELNAYNKSLNIPENATSARTRIAEAQENFGKGIPNYKDGNEFSYYINTRKAYDDLDNNSDEEIKRKFSFDDYVSPGNPNEQRTLMDRGEIFADSMADTTNSFIQNDLSTKMNPSEIFEDSMEDNTVANQKLGDVSGPKYSSDKSKYELEAFPTVVLDGEKTDITGDGTVDISAVAMSVLDPESKVGDKEGTVGSAVKKVTKDKDVLSALEILQAKVDSYQKSPELIAAELEQFMTEAGYLEDVDQELHKGAMMFAVAIAMGANLSQAMSASYGQLAYEDEQQQIVDQANKDRMMDLLKTNGKYMNKASWKSALDGMNLSQKDQDYLDVLYQTSNAEATETAAATYLESVQDLEKELLELVHIKTGDGKNTDRMPEFLDMVHSINVQMSKAGNSKQFLTGPTKTQLVEAYTDWEKYLAQPAEKTAAWWKIWDWFGTPAKKILDPIVFYEGNQGLIGAAGTPSIPIDKDDPNYEYILIAQQYNGIMHNSDRDKMDAEELSIYNQWFKEVKGKGGAFNDLDKYPYYFAVEIKERLKEKL